MSKRLFVGSLSWDTSEDVLREAFERFGDIVDLKVITDRDTGRSRGFGFITFDDPNTADRAMSEMDGSTLDGRSIKVNEAQARESRGSGGGGNRGGGGGRW